MSQTLSVDEFVEKLKKSFPVKKYGALIIIDLPEETSVVAGKDRIDVDVNFDKIIIEKDRVKYIHYFFNEYVLEKYTGKWCVSLKRENLIIHPVE